MKQWEKKKRALQKENKERTKIEKKRIIGKEKDKKKRTSPKRTTSEA